MTPVGPGGGCFADHRLALVCVLDQPLAHDGEMSVRGDDGRARGTGGSGSSSDRSSSTAPTILSHLLTLPSQTLLRLYSHPSNALAIFRLLPPIARHLVFVLLFLPDPPRLPSSDVAALFGREKGIAASSKGDRSVRGSSTVIKAEYDDDDIDGADEEYGAGTGRTGQTTGAGSSRRRGGRARALESAKDMLSRLGIIKETGGSVYLNGIWTEALRRALIGG